MKLVKILTTLFIALVCVGLLLLGALACDVDTPAQKIFWFIWLFISCGILPNVILVSLNRKFDKELEEIKKNKKELQALKSS